MENNTLTIKIDSDQLKIDNLFQALKSIEEGIQKESYTETEIYIKEVRKGSIIIELIQVILAGSLPFAENANSIISFIEKINKYKTMLLSSNKERIIQEKDIDKSAIKELDTIANAISNNPNANIQINTFNNCSFSLDSQESTQIQKNSQQYLSDSHSNEDKSRSQIVSNALISFVQTNTKSKKADKAICEKISKKEVKTFIENTEVKKNILKNPYKYNFIVDLEVQYKDNKPTLYTILQLKEKFENDD
ncbi:hypothetical protein CCZ01_06125 [Helicobacter monodelphidis]|uniref:hypothetical protein n=1 Tax=Helicobacter sp. 15-1451 TaxID=2004995 RepID=UPI000DCF0285|nr:hypothetical protein [Helicobacter sp. 15-1451]RAX57412.1 hypothetical protein CCZ01_06125 [Helicobacter sp. 15-1451]